MPAPNKSWRHLILNTLSTWLHGDPRGFRSRNHELHSNGDYKHPPPPGEHERLHRWMKRRARKEVHIPQHLRPIVGCAIRDYLRANGHHILCIAVGKVHTHGLAELPIDLRQIRAIIGECKRKSSRAIKKEMPGNVWSAG